MPVALEANGYDRAYLRVYGGGGAWRGGAWSVNMRVSLIVGQEDTLCWRADVRAGADQPAHHRAASSSAHHSGAGHWSR